MIERTIVLPHQTNNGKSNEERITRIQGELLALVGGFSALEQVGVWMDESGKIYQDRSVRLVTACEQAQDEIVQSRIPVWCELLEQECIYTHYTEVNASFVEPACKRVLVG